MKDDNKYHLVWILKYVLSLNLSKKSIIKKDHKIKKWIKNQTAKSHIKYFLISKYNSTF